MNNTCNARGCNTTITDKSARTVYQGMDPVKVCQGCYNIAERATNKRNKERFKANNQRPFTHEDYKEQVLDDFRRGAI